MPSGNWRPATSVETLAALAALRRRIRDYFDTAGVLEVQTPCLGVHTVTAPSIESFRVELSPGKDPRFLQTSPEYFMKRLLAAGAPDIYQFGPVFRAGEAGRRHQPEFTMIEWYRHGMTLDDIVADTLAVIAEASQRRWPIVRLRYGDVFADVLGIDAYSDNIEAARRLLDEHAPSGLTSFDAVLDWLFVAHIAPTFPRDQLTVLTHYPASQAALAQLDPADPRAALRFEVFAGTLELANGFVELADSNDQALRFEADRRQRRANGQELVAADPALLAALAQGLPACAGVALGFERVAMLTLDHDDIASVMAFAPVPTEPMEA